MEKDAIRFNERYERLLRLAQSLPPVTTAVAHPCDEISLKGAVEAARFGLIAPILVGPPDRVRGVAEQAGLDPSGSRCCAGPGAFVFANDLIKKMPAPGCRDFRSWSRESPRRSGHAPDRGSISRAVALWLPRYAGRPPAASRTSACPRPRRSARRGIVNLAPVVFSLCRWRGGSVRKVLCSPIVLPRPNRVGQQKGALGPLS
jgi:hypothetical protein